MSPDRDPDHLYPPFRAKVLRILAMWDDWCQAHAPGYRPMLFEGFRSTARQQELYAQGRTVPGQIVTRNNGTTQPSNHQSSLAVDLLLARNGNPTWSPPAGAWDYLGHLARAEGLVWGGDWKSITDYPHVQWPEEAKATYLAAHQWQISRGLR